MIARDFIEGRALISTVLIGLYIAALAGCGGGSGSTLPQIPAFTLAVSPGSLTLAQGGNQTLQISVSGQGGFSGTVSITGLTVPTGLSVSPSAISAAPGSPATVTLSATSNAPIGELTVDFSGTSGSLSDRVSLSITVQGAAVPDPFHYIGGELVHGFYDESRQLLFATNIGLNEVDVISGADDSLKARIPVSQPIGIDQMADGNTLVIGTAAQELVTVNENTYAVTVHPYSVAGSYFTQFFPTVVALANGNVLALGQEQGVESDDTVNGGQDVIEWTPSSDTFTVVSTNGSDRLARSGDGKWAAFSSDQFYLFSSDSDSVAATVPLNTVDPPDNSFGVRGYALNSDGSRIAVASATQVSFFDRSLNLLGTAQIPGAFQSAGSTVKYSADGAEVFLQYALPLAIEEVDVATAAAAGYLSGTVTPDSDSLEGLMAIDAEGRAWLNIDGGVRQVSLSQRLIPSPSGTAFPGANCPQLSTAAPLNAPEQIQEIQPVANVSIYVGGQPASVASGGTAINLPASGIAGPADVECIDTQGNTTVNAQDVSYGMDPVALSANLLPPTGNVTVYLFGFGFSPQNPSIPWYSETPPSATLNGASATKITLLESPGMGALQGDVLQTPRGTPGESIDVGVSSSLGTGTLASAATYYPMPTIVPASGVLQLTFDTQRNRLYALTASEVDVLDGATLQWDAPLAFPTNFSGTIQSMAITPDGSKLAISATDPQPAMIVLGLTDGTATLTVDSGYLYGTSGSIAVTNRNTVLIGPGLLFDLSTLTFSTVGVGNVLRASADGSHIYSADLNESSGGVYSIDPSTLAVQSEQFGYMFWTDLAVSPDGSQFAAVDAPPYAAGDAVGFFNSSLQYVNANVYPYYSPPDDTGVLGVTYSPGGKVLVVPLGDSIELWDAATGKLRARLMTPEELQVLVYPENAVAPMIALNALGDTIFAVSKSGISVIPLPQPMDQMPTMQWPELRRAVSLRASPASHGTITDRMRAIGGSRKSQLSLARPPSAGGGR